VIALCGGGDGGRRDSARYGPKATLRHSRPRRHRLHGRSAWRRADAFRRPAPRPSSSTATRCWSRASPMRVDPSARSSTTPRCGRQAQPHPRGHRVHTAQQSRWRPAARRATSALAPAPGSSRATTSSAFPLRSCARRSPGNSRERKGSAGRGSRRTRSCSSSHTAAIHVSSRSGQAGCQSRDSHS